LRRALQRKRKTFRKSASGKKIVLFKGRKPGKPKCGLCGALLHGVPSKRIAELRKLGKTEKRPERVFGGVLCANCAQRVVIDETRLRSGVLRVEDIPLTRLKYVKALQKI